MEKLFYSISEVATLLGESVSCVRFWTNSFPKQLSPRRSAKGNRQYVASDIEVLRQIQHLVKTQGMTLEGARKELENEPEKSDRTVKAIESLKAIKAQLLEIKNSL